MLTLQYMPYTEIEHLSSDRRISKLLDLVKTDKILLLEGRLKTNEETELIRKTMESIDDKFSGIELSVIYPEDKNAALLRKFKNLLLNVVLGDRRGMTIIGPANVVKEIKPDPDKIQLFTAEANVESARSSSKSSRTRKKK